MTRRSIFTRWLDLKQIEGETWRRQIRDAVAYQDMEDILVQDMCDAVGIGSLSPEECGQLLIEWAEQRPGLLEQRLLVDLFRLLKVCTVEKARRLLGRLASATDSFKNLDKRNAAFAELCQHLSSVLEGATIQTDQLVIAVRQTMKTTNNLGDLVIGVAGAAELYSYYSRLSEFHTALANSRSSLPRIFISTREQSVTPPMIDCVETAQKWLDRFAVDETRKDDVAYLTPGLLWFYIEQAEQALASEMFGGTVLEHRLCSILILEAKKACKRLDPKCDLIAWLEADRDEIVCRIANRGGQACQDFTPEIRNETSGHSEGRESSCEFEPFSALGESLRIPELMIGANNIWINARRQEEDRPPCHYNIYRTPSDALPSEVKLLVYRHKYDSTEKFRQWFYEPVLWEKVVLNSLDQGGAIKIVYGLPRVGKTTVLKHIQELLLKQLTLASMVGQSYRREELVSPDSASREVSYHNDIAKSSINQIPSGTPNLVPVYINLESLKLSGVENASVSLFQIGFIEEVERILVDELKWKHRIRFDEVLQRPVEQFFLEYLDNVRELLSEQSAELLVLVDEWSMLWTLHPEIRRRVLEIIGATTRVSQDVQFVYCATGLVDRELANEYSLVAETDFSLIPAVPFDMKQVRSALTSWLHGENLPEICYDDLAIELVAKYTGGHPMLLQVFAHHITKLLRDQTLALPISWYDVERMWQSLLSQSTGTKQESDFAQFRESMYGALETIWLGLRDMSMRTNDRFKLKQVLNGESWAYLPQMLKCGLIRLDERQRPVLGIAALEPWYQRWASGQE